MSFGTPPILPPVPGTPNGPSDYRPSTVPMEYPPWLGSASVTFPPAAADPTTNTTTYEPGPYCFGLDQYICAYLPEKIHVGGAPTSIMERIAPGFDIPVWKFCYALTNALCAILALLLLLTILGIAFAGLIF